MWSVSLSVHLQEVCGRVWSFKLETSWAVIRIPSLAILVEPAREEQNTNRTTRQRQPESQGFRREQILTKDYYWYILIIYDLLISGS